MPKRATGAARLVRPLLSLLALIAVAAASAATTWLWTSQTQQTAAADTSAATGTTPVRPAVALNTPPPPPIFLGLDAFTVTLQNSNIERMVHMKLTLRMDDDASRERIERYMPEVRSRVLMVLSNQSPDAVITPKGKMNLAEAVLTALAEPFKPLNEGQSVRDVLFTEFVVQ